MAERNSSAVWCGFTLVELLVVMSIISILAGLIISVIPVGKGNKVACMNNLRHIGIAATQYSHDFGSYPWVGDSEPAAAFQLLVDEGLIDEPRLFICPSCNQREADYNEGKFTLARENVSYAYAAEPIALSAPSRTIIAADAYWYGEDGQGHRDCIIVVRKSSAAQEVRLRPGDRWEDATGGKLNR